MVQKKKKTAIYHERQTSIEERKENLLYASIILRCNKASFHSCVNLTEICSTILAGPRNQGT